MPATWFETLRSENVRRTRELYRHPIQEDREPDSPLGWTVTTWILAAAGEFGEALNKWEKDTARR